MQGTGEHGMLRLRHLILWLILAAAALTALGGVLIMHDRSTLLKWSVFLATDLDQGRVVFHEKGCTRCHSVNGMGGKIGPDLGGEGIGPTSLPSLVTAMWNHAPPMWNHMRAEHFSYPTLSYEQTAQIVAYVYMASRMDAAGNAQRGKKAFASTGCIRCHSAAEISGASQAKTSGNIAVQTPMTWAQTIWNHAPAMEKAVRGAGLRWPKLEASELNDLFAYVRSSAQDPVVPQQIPGDPEKGWQVFQAKGCINCHLPRDENRSGPENWPSQTFMQVAELMWNDAPEMLKAMKNRGMAGPKFSGKEMTDLAAFVYTLQYFDPPGSAIVGRSVFRWRGCSHCHGSEAQGSGFAPALRGQGRNYNSISLATALWSHGHKMFQRSQQLGVGWPTLQPGDVGDVLAFLNSPMKDRRGSK